MPDSAQWLALSSLAALVCGALLLLARLLRLGFLGDFLSASVLIGFLTGVGIQVFTGQIPDMLGISKGSGNWFEQQWHTLTHLGETSLPTLAFAVGTLALILGFKRFAPTVPGAIVAVVLSIIVSASLQMSTHGVAVVGTVQGGFPPIGLPQGVGWSDIPGLAGVAFSCFVLIIAQSAATSRSFAARHGERVDVNQDLVGLSGANVAAGLTGTFVVNGSPTKTQILDGQHGKSQVANMTMAVVVLVVLLFLTGALTDMPKAVLAAIVFLIGIDLVDIAGLRRVWAARRSEFYVAVITAVTVFAVGVEQGIVLAIVLSLVEMVRRQYRPHQFVVSVTQDGKETYALAKPGMQSSPGLLVFRFDADLFYANANQFSENVQQLVSSAPDPVSWLILDCSSIPDVDYSAGAALKGLVKFVHTRGATFALAAADPNLRTTLSRLGVLDELPREPRLRLRGGRRGRLPLGPGSPGRRVRTRAAPDARSGGGPSPVSGASVPVRRPRRRPRRRGVRELTRPPRCSPPRVLPRRARAGCGRTRAATTRRAAGARSRAPWGSAASPPHAPSPEPGRAVRGRRRG